MSSAKETSPKALEIFDDEIIINLRFKKIDEFRVERRKLFSDAQKKQIYKQINVEKFPYNNFIESTNARTNAINWASENNADLLLLKYSASILKGEIIARAFRVEEHHSKV